jgi:hypothetical protein
MISEALHSKAVDIICRMEYPRNESERLKRDWARAVTENNESLAFRIWKDYCLHMEQCGVAET